MVKITVGDLRTLPIPISCPVSPLAEVCDVGAWQPKLQFAAVDHHGTACCSWQVYLIVGSLQELVESCIFEEPQSTKAELHTTEIFSADAWHAVAETVNASGTQRD